MAEAQAQKPRKSIKAIVNFYCHATCQFSRHGENAPALRCAENFSPGKTEHHHHGDFDRRSTWLVGVGWLSSPAWHIKPMRTYFITKFMKGH